MDRNAALTGPVHVIGASGRSGAALCRLLAAEGIGVVPVVRSLQRWEACGLPGAPRLADIADAVALAAAMSDAVIVVSCAHARHVAAILAAAPAARRFVFLGSTRKFTRWPDAHGNGVLAGEAAFLASKRHGVILHPTMIYGAAGEDNVRRLAAALRRLPAVPLPQAGRTLIQPIYQDDLTRCIVAAASRPWDGPHSLVVAGPTPLTYADFVRAIEAAVGLPQRPILPVPAGVLMLAASITYLPWLPRIRGAEIRRLLEDKAFEIDDMVRELGVMPRTMAEGLALTFAR